MLNSFFLMFGMMSVSSAVPNTVSQQGRLLDATGVPLTGDHQVQFTIYDTPSNVAIWSESFELVAMESGYYSVVLGQSEALNIAAWDGEEYSLGISVDQGTELSPRHPLNAVPFALVARSVQGGEVNASVVRVGGAEVISGTGEFVGSVSYNTLNDRPDLSASSVLSSLGCVDGEQAQLSGSVWGCVAPNEHMHSASDLSSGTIDSARFTFGTGVGEVAEGDHTHLVSSLTGPVDADTLLGAVPAAVATSGKYSDLIGLPDSAALGVVPVTGDSTINGSLNVTGRLSGSGLQFYTCPTGHYDCTPKACLTVCQDNGGRIATRDEVYAWASGGNDLCNNFWMVDSDFPTGAYYGYVMYYNRTASGCGALNTGDVPRIVNNSPFSWNETTQRANCMCSTLN